MGSVKEYYLQRQQDEYFEMKVEWIREQLGDPEADENSEGWDDLSDEYDEWHSDEYDNQYEDDWSVEGKTRLEIFNENMSAVREISKSNLSQETTACLMVMLHAHIVSSMEAYLSSTFIDTVLLSEQFIRKLIESDPEFSNRKFTLNEIFLKRESLEEDIKVYLKALIFHDLKKIKPMYKDVFDIDFGDIGWLFTAVNVRHHCVHRAGYDKEGKEVSISVFSIEDLLNKCESLVKSIESGIKGLSIPELQFW